MPQRVPVAARCWTHERSYDREDLLGYCFATYRRWSSSPSCLKISVPTTPTSSLGFGLQSLYIGLYGRVRVCVLKTYGYQGREGKLVTIPKGAEHSWLVNSRSWRGKRSSQIINVEKLIRWRNSNYKKVLQAYISFSLRETSYLTKPICMRREY